PDEGGLNGISIELRDATGRTLGSTYSGASRTVDADGYYVIGGLPQGVATTYTLFFGDAPTGYQPSPADKGANESVDSDVINGRATVQVGDVIDAGFYEDALTNSGVIFGRIWGDVNGDGIRAWSELAGPDVTVQLRDHTGRIIRTSPSFTRSAYGQPLTSQYRFGGLGPGTYTVTFGGVSGYVVSPADQGTSDDHDSDIDPVTRSTVVTLGVGDVVKVEAGYVEDNTSAISGFVWLDIDNDGVFSIWDTAAFSEASSLGRKVLVRLYDGTGRIVREMFSESWPVGSFPLPAPGFTAESDPGPYSFQGLAAGTYTLEFSNLPGHVFSTRDVGTDDTADSDVDTLGRVEVTVAAAEHKMNVDAGLVEFTGTGMIEGRVWYDVNGDGSRRSEFDRGMGGIGVRLLDRSTSRLLYETTTSQRDYTAGRIRKPRGTFVFSGLPPGDYQIQVSRPGGFVFSPPNADLDNLDSDFDSSGRLDVTLGDGDRITSIAAGLVRSTASIGDFVWEDRDGDGIRDPGEPGIDGVPVGLYDETGTRLIARTTTADGGHYFFGLDDGNDDYVVEFGLPAGYAFTLPHQGSDPRVDSNPDPDSGRALLALGFDATDTSIDAGLVRLAGPAVGAISDRVWLDQNGDGIQDPGEPGLADVTVHLWDNRHLHRLAETVTTSAGNYSFQGISPGDYSIQVIPRIGFGYSPADQGVDDAIDSDANPIGGFVDVTVVAGLRTTDIDVGLVPLAQTNTIASLVWNDIDGDGVRDIGEPGLDGVDVLLYEATGLRLIAATTSENGGLYSFSGLPQGGYMVEVLRPGGFDFSPADQGNDDSADSDVDQLSGRTGEIKLSLGQTEDTIGAGLLLFSNGNTASIGNFVFNDMNGNGIQDVGEPGIDGVQVRLLDATASLIINDTLTRGGGHYEFLGLDQGDYVVEVIAPLGHAFSPQTIGGDGQVDSDVDVATGRTSVLTLIASEELTSIDIGLIEQFPSTVTVSSAFAGVLIDDDPDGAGPRIQFGKDSYASISQAIEGLDALPSGTVVELLGETYDTFNFDRTGGILHLNAAQLATVLQATIAHGSVLAEGTIAVPGGVLVEAGGTLGGIGTIDGTVVINGGVLAPGFSPGILHTGSLSFGIASTYQVELAGVTPGVGGHDQTVVNGTVNLVGATLNLVIDYAPAIGDQWIVIENDGLDPITGTFAGLDEGDAVLLGDGLEATISYIGGTGNDVVLTVQAADSQPPSLLGFTRFQPPSAFTNADSLAFLAEFSEPVTQIDANDFLIVGTTTAMVTSVLPVAATGETIFLITVEGGDLASFDGSVGLDLAPAQNIQDAGGNLLPNVEPAIDQTYEVDNTAPQVTQFGINDGSAQRSIVKSISFDFDSLIVYAAGAFSLQDDSGQSIDFIIDRSPGELTSRVVLSFPTMIGDSLTDGNYQMAIDQTLIADAAGNILDGNNDGIAGGARAVDEFFRFFGDMDGDRDVDARDARGLR
ncbi:MAG: hypothetical protein KDB00_26380, partial [Planctomycetales bacterium]|nr:hypothetical protein [Planctomycetales bacterium]